MGKEKAVLICSGGLDSTILLYELLEDYDVQVLTFDYGQKHKREIKCAKKTCKILGLNHKVINLHTINSLLQGSCLTSNEVVVPEGHYSDDSMKATVVPNRNMIMLSLAIGYAESLGVNKVFFGNHTGDRAQYPDCRWEFVQALSEASKLGTYNHVEVFSPFNSLTKEQIVGIGIVDKVPFKNTWSCYKGQKRPCGKCGTCVERVEAFNENGKRDPLLTKEEWKAALEYLNTVKV